MAVLAALQPKKLGHGDVYNLCSNPRPISHVVNSDSYDCTDSMSTLHNYARFNHVIAIFLKKDASSTYVIYCAINQPWVSRV